MSRRSRALYWRRRLPRLSRGPDLTWFRRRWRRRQRPGWNHRRPLMQGSGRTRGLGGSRRRWWSSQGRTNRLLDALLFGLGVLHGKIRCEGRLGDGGSLGRLAGFSGRGTFFQCRTVGMPIGFIARALRRQPIVDSQFVGYIFIDRTGVRQFLSYTQLREKFQDKVGLHFQFPSEHVYTDLLHKLNTG